MKLNYQNTKLKKLLCDAIALKKKFGAQVADKTIQCLQELDAADNLDDIPQRLRPHPREPKHEEIFQVDILKHKHSTRLHFRPLDDYDIEDHTTITSIEVIEIIKTHS
ncbi:hypothetical protein H6784_03530 [Candidatus Nomurabacteria bacterium]|nr:hypothetical protein [Candidatus Kaiserbacteria bacterium]MCB9814462.1 hypothetical protein [Candidatus Nomurabacteria bacterium]